MDKKPNIIIYFSDQQRPDTMGCYGQRLNVTPVLDAVAKKGALFNRAYTPQPVCGPARACLQTGKYATQTGCFRNAIGLDPSENTMAHYLKSAGYATGYVGKWHLASTPDAGTDYEKTAIPKPYRGGYEFWRASDILEFTSHGYGGHVYDEHMQKKEFQGYRVDGITDYALEFLEQSKDHPFFLFLSHIEPHHQNDHNQYEGPIGSKEMFADFDIPKDLAFLKGDYEESYPDYLGCCHALDRNFGRIIHWLDTNGMLEDTIIFYFSDHGCHFRTRNSEYKRSCHEASIHIPMIIHGGPFTGMGEQDAFVSLLDIPPTILELANIKVPESMQGQSLVNIHKSDTWRDNLYIQISEDHLGRALKTDRYKYEIEAIDCDPWDDAVATSYREVALYDLREDPFETNNLIFIDGYESVLEDLRQKIKHEMYKANEPEATIVHPLEE